MRCVRKIIGCQATVKSVGRLDGQVLFFYFYYCSRLKKKRKTSTIEVKTTCLSSTIKFQFIEKKDNSPAAAWDASLTIYVVHCLSSPFSKKHKHLFWHCLSWRKVKRLWRGTVSVRQSVLHVVGSVWVLPGGKTPEQRIRQEKRRISLSKSRPLTRNTHTHTTTLLTWHSTRHAALSHCHGCVGYHMTSDVKLQNTSAQQSGGVAVKRE